MKKATPEEVCWRELEDAKSRLAEAEARLAQRDIEATELKHRIANNLQLAASFLILQERRLKPGKAKSALAAASARLAAVSNFHRYLAHNMGRPTLDLAAFLMGLGPEICAGCGLQCQVEVEPVEVSAETAMNLALVINELAINASKHAYDGAGGALHVRSKRVSGEEIVVSVADNGPGLRDGFDGNAGGLGMSIINSIIRQLGATLSAETRAEGGACFTLRAPLQPAGQARP